MKNVFLIYVRSSFRFWDIYVLSLLFGYVKERVDKKAKIKFKVHGVTDWTSNNWYTHIVQYLKK